MSLRAQVCEMFDLVCGTSTGGLLALALGVLRVQAPGRTCCERELCEQLHASVKK